MVLCCETVSFFITKKNHARKNFFQKNVNLHYKCLFFTGNIPCKNMNSFLNEKLYLIRKKKRNKHLPSRHLPAQS